MQLFFLKLDLSDWNYGIKHLSAGIGPFPCQWGALCYLVSVCLVHKIVACTVQTLLVHVLLDDTLHVDITFVLVMTITQPLWL